ncbi:hypothetical protein JMJ35_004561 [Cladonia borealis]|uniref:O-methyltransferase C-terminal domain-containing protein n=1 Tax=Cladonia borealis TaxID=184061 RepID=A0AA39R2B7_9LECA|nr:hypothetical protein JMJ35_004561 [Cladonia borealis]
MSSHTDLLGLAVDITTYSKQIVDRLRESGHGQPSYAVDSPRELWENPKLGLKEVKSKLTDSANTLLTLINGPMLFHRNLFGVHYDLAALQIVLDFNVLESIPVKGSIDLDTLSAKVGIDKNKLGRLLRLLGTQRYVEEPQFEVFQHTMLSEVLLRDELLKAQGSVQLDDMHKASVEASNYLRANPNCDKSEVSPFKHKYGTSLYEFYDTHPQKAIVFAKAMQGITRFDRPFTLLTQWIQDTGSDTGKMIDVGGGSGHIVLGLAKEFPAWNFVVQDLHDNMFAETLSEATKDLSSRVAFVHHDFFTTQSLYQGVDAWVLRQCLHNWSDEDGAKILKQFVPAMEKNPKTALLVNESIIPNHGDLPFNEERSFRQIDIAMFVTTNAKQRTEGDWRALIASADPRLRITRILRDTGTMGVIEIHLDTGYTNGNGTEQGHLLHDGGYANGDGMGQEHLQLNS